VFTGVTEGQTKLSVKLGKKAVDFCLNMQRPEAGDYWETPLHAANPLAALAVRVIGKPACGNNPKQSFSSCAGLAVYKQ